MEFTPVFECTAPDGKCPYRNNTGVCLELIDLEDNPWICDYLVIKRKPVQNGIEKLPNAES